MGSTKKALLASGLSLLCCVLLLMGTTFAWFTDSVVVSGNKIQAGTLKISMLKWDKESNAYGEVDTLFNCDILEPGRSEAAAIQIQNTGSLALKYELGIIAGGKSESGIEELLDVYCYVAEATADGGIPQIPDDAKPIGKLSDVIGGTIADGTLTAAGSKGDSDYLVIAIKMPESVGDDYQGTSSTITFDIVLNATQLNDAAKLPEIPDYAVSNSGKLTQIIEQAEDGDVILLSSETPIVINEVLSINKSITFIGDGETETVNLRLNINGDEGDADVTLKNLKITGNSYINTVNAGTLTMTDCVVDVTITDANLTGRAAYIVTGTGEQQSVKLNVQGNTFNIKSTKDAYAAVIFGWNYIKDGSIIANNTFGSKENRYRFIAVKLMNFEDGANVTIEGNTVYGTNEYYGFYAFDMYQNNSRDNKYTATFKNNAIDVDIKSDKNDAYFIDLEVNVLNGTGGNATIVVDEGNTFNNEAVTDKHVLIEQAAAGNVIFK